MVSVDTLLFAFSLIDDSCLLFLTVYYVITLSDLECDYINATQCCSRMNKFIIPEMVGHGILTFFMFITLHYWLFLINLPLSVWLIYQFLSIPPGAIGLYDPTEIHNRHRLKDSMKECMVKLALHLIVFFLYLYNLIVALIGK